MDASQFDRFTASLPRRTVMGGLLAVVLGASTADAKKKKKKGKKKPKRCADGSKPVKGQCPVRPACVCGVSACGLDTCGKPTCGTCPEGKFCEKHGVVSVCVCPILTCEGVTVPPGTCKVLTNVCNEPPAICDNCGAGRTCDEDTETCCSMLSNPCSETSDCCQFITPTICLGNICRLVD